jgi:glycosyltransferase involved in cell wall biosynthesis
MKVSIVIPTYNGSRFLREAIESACKQDYEDKEIIVVDDCSTDDTPRIASRYPVKVYQHSGHVGMVANWNFCFDLAEGEWIKFLHQDDILDSACVSEMVRASTRWPKAKIITCDRALMFDESVPLWLRIQSRELAQQSSIGLGCYERTYFKPRAFAKKMARMPLINAIGEPSAVMVHRSALKAVGAFNENLVQLVDWEYFARVALWKGIIFIPDKLAYYRVHQGSQTRKNMTGNTMLAEWRDPILIVNELANSRYFRRVRWAASPHDFAKQFKEMTTVHVLC